MVNLDRFGTDLKDRDLDDVRLLVMVSAVAAMSLLFLFPHYPPFSHPHFDRLSNILYHPRRGPRHGQKHACANFRMESSTF